MRRKAVRVGADTDTRELMSDDIPRDEQDAPVPEPLPESEPPAMVVAEVAPDGEPEDGALAPYDPLQRYLTEIRRYPLLSREEEHRLAVQYKDHQDLDAAYRLVTANLRLVVMIAREYQRAFKNILDLIQEGNIGLMEAVKKYDPYRGIRFPSYAVWWVRAYIIRYMMNNWRMVKIGTTQAQRKLFFNLQKEKDRLEAEGFAAGPKLLAQRLDVKESEIVEMQQRLSARDLSVDAPAGTDDETTMLDYLASANANTEDTVGEAETRELISRKVQEFGATLSGKDKVIFESRLMAEEPLTLQDIGDRYGISRERVRQIEERIKKKLKAYLLAETPDLEDAVIDIIR
jgi:RNA polymerase sigma-32 factor